MDVHEEEDVESSCGFFVSSNVVNGTEASGERSLVICSVAKEETNLSNLCLLRCTKSLFGVGWLSFEI